MHRASACGVIRGTSTRSDHSTSTSGRVYRASVGLIQHGVLVHHFVDFKVTQDCEEQADDRIAVVQKSIFEFHASAAKIKETEHSDFVTPAATRLLKLAMNRLNNFYAPKLDKPAQKADRVQVLQADRVDEPYTSKLEKNEQGQRRRLAH